MFYLLLFIIVAGLVVAGVVVVRHFPAVAQLDLEHLPTEQEQRKKKEILTKRLEAEGARLRERAKVWLKPLGVIWQKNQQRFRRYFRRIEKLWHHEKTLLSKRQGTAGDFAPEDLQAQIKRGEEALSRGEHEIAEAAFISAITLNKKSEEAYRGLAQTYVARELWEEAKQTYLFLAKLAKDDDKVYAALGEIAEHQNDVQKAIEYYQQAVVLNDSFSPRFYHLAELLLKVKQPQVAKEAIVSALALEPKNPKYLDLLTETAILCNDKQAAETAYQELRLANPENQKLVEFKERISSLN